MKKEYLPMALGFWGSLSRCLSSGLVHPDGLRAGRDFLLGGIFLLVGALIFKAKR